MFAGSLPSDTAEANKTVALVICLLCSRKLSISQSLRERQGRPSEGIHTVLQTVGEDERE